MPRHSGYVKREPRKSLPVSVLSSPPRAAGPGGVTIGLWFIQRM